MARASSIDKLHPDILAKLQELLRDPRVSQLDVTARINAILADMGEEPISKSAVNRYSMRMDKVGEKLRQSRAVSEMWIAKLGAAPQGQVGHLVNELLRTLAFDLTIKMSDGDISEDDMPGMIDMLKNLSLSMMRLEKAASENVKREQEIKEQARRDAANAAENAAKQAGASNEFIQKMRREILGITS